jgi:Zn ribbon nucleic-acid-binding protein
MNPAIARHRLIAKAVVLVTAMSAWLDAWLRHRLHARRCITYGPMHQRDQERQNNLRFIYESTDVECADLLRMRRAPFMQLCDLFRTRQLLRDSIHSSVEEQVAMFLHVVGHNQRFRVIHMTFRRSIETISRYFKEVLYAVGELRNEMILPPSTATPTKIRDSHRWYPYFKVSQIQTHHYFSCWVCSNKCLPQCVGLYWCH